MKPCPSCGKNSVYRAPTADYLYCSECGWNDVHFDEKGNPR